jgi:hypothetical protein
MQVSATMKSRNGTQSKTPPTIEVQAACVPE